MSDENKNYDIWGNEIPEDASVDQENDLKAHTEAPDTESVVIDMADAQNDPVYEAEPVVNAEADASVEESVQTGPVVNAEVHLPGEGGMQSELVADTEPEYKTGHTSVTESAVDPIKDIYNRADTETTAAHEEIPAQGQNPYGMGGSQENFYRFASGPDNDPPEPSKPVKAKKSHKAAIIGISCAAVLLVLLGVGVYKAVDYVNDRFAEYEAALEEVEETTAPANQLTKVDGTISSTDTSNGAVFLDVSGVVDKVMPSVVCLTVNLEYESNNMFWGSSTQSSSASGSGVIIGESEEELLIVTNNHVISDDEQTYYYTVNTTALVVTFCDGSTAEAYVKGTDAEKDLAVIAISMEDLSEETKSAIQVATIGDSDAAKVGNGVIAIGNALGYGQSCTVGYISALNRDITFSDGTTRTLMQVDAAINPGNSGGGLFDIYGNLIGINESKNISENAEGIGYAIPISSVEDILTELMNTVPRTAYDDDEKGYLGIQGSDVPSAYVSAGYPSGAIVLQIFEDGGAAQSDLQLQDIITKINDVEITSMTALMEELSYYRSGETVILEVERIYGNKFQTVQVEVTLGNKTTLPEDDNSNSQGGQNGQNSGGSSNGLDGLLP